MADAAMFCRWGSSGNTCWLLASSQKVSFVRSHVFRSTAKILCGRLHHGVSREHKQSSAVNISFCELFLPHGSRVNLTKPKPQRWKFRTPNAKFTQRIALLQLQMGLSVSTIALLLAVSQLTSGLTFLWTQALTYCSEPVTSHCTCFLLMIQLKESFKTIRLVA